MFSSNCNKLHVVDPDIALRENRNANSFPCGHLKNRSWLKTLDDQSIYLTDFLFSSTVLFSFGSTWWHNDTGSLEDVLSFRYASQVIGFGQSPSYTALAKYSTQCPCFHPQSITVIDYVGESLWMALKGSSWQGQRYSWCIMNNVIRNASWTSVT